ncbi:type II and III secretion system protein family protein [Sphingomonas populi]|uniref:Type II and III secretion system protein family protein n=1 Tax=Sphingomonas populi TaxID=2484750 RepID=A0A4Q6Y227_9SPHN|nr:type II and III secretion system protein family protein [Sphingomonas populi]RZF66331.1 type II and III secretion system protein family protein [Sphingomonas populi]
MRAVSKSIGWPLAVALVAGGASAAPLKRPQPRRAAPAAVPASTLLQVSTGRGRLINLPRPITDVFVASDAIADVQVRSPTQLYVFGKGQGETTVSATAAGGAVVYSATVRVGNNFDTVQQMLNMAMPESHITATTMNGLVLLTGTIASPGDGAEAERLVQSFVGDSTKVLSRLKSATPLQVNLQVRFAEVSRSFVKNIGVNLNTVDRTGGFKFGVGQGRGAATKFSPGGPMGVGFTQAPSNGSLISQVTNGTTIGAAGKLFGLDLISSLDLGEQDGQVTTLANPNLTALSGETGTFLAGGEIPIPVSQGLGAVSVEYKQYGVMLAYTPTVLADGRISLRVRPEVSQLTSEGSVTLNGTTIPALSTRRAETTVELGSGQSFMIAGLLQNDHNNAISKAPGVGDMPVLGALFRSNAFKRNETELVIVITPYLVKPVDANQIVLPTDGYKAPTDLDQILFGHLGGGTTGAQRPKPRLAAPVTVQPVLGAATPVPSPPAAPPPRDRAVAATDPKSTKPGAAMPGFDN